MDDIKAPKFGSVHHCPHHPINTIWYWCESCCICRSILSQDGGVLSKLNEEPRTRFDASDPDYDNAARPGECINSDSRSHLQSLYYEGALSPSVHGKSKRDRRRQKANLKFPPAYPRKGSDTNLSSFTGRSLSIEREGLATIGRTISGAKTCNSSGFPWRAI